MYCLLAYQLFSRARFLCRVYGDGHITEGVLRSHLTPGSYDPARRFLGRPAPGNQPDRFRRRRRVLGPGLFIAWRYIGDWGGLTGTGYVVMVSIKAMLLATGLILGAMNFFLVGGWPRQRETVTTPLRVRAFVEAETGLGITVLLAAASLTSLPPSTSSPIRPPREEVIERFVPKMRRLSSPPVSDLLAVAAPIDDTLAAPQPEECA